MPRALNKMTKGGAGYQRPPEIAAGIDAALKLDLNEQLRRADIGDPTDPDYMPSECLLHLLREARLTGDKRAVDRLLPPLLARFERRLKRTIPDSWPDAQGLRDEVLQAFCELLARVGSNHDATALDIFECKFNKGLAALRYRRLRRENSRDETGDVPEIRGFDTPDDEAAGIAACIRQLEKDGVPQRDQAVLSRTNPRIDEIARALEARGIPVLHLGSLFEREEIRDLLSLLTLATDRFGAGLVRICAMPRYQTPIQDVKRMLDQLRDGDKPALSRLDELSGLSGISSQASAAIKRLAADCAGLKPAQGAWDYVKVPTTLLEHLNEGQRRAFAIADTRVLSSPADSMRCLRELAVLGQHRSVSAAAQRLQQTSRRWRTRNGPLWPRQNKIQSARKASAWMCSRMIELPSPRFIMAPSADSAIV
jgi:hypothetical protein